jgi:hypothetical protein
VIDISRREVAELVAVPFAGEDGGTGPLSWGQQSIWAEMARAGNSLPMTASRALEPDETEAKFVDELSFYLSRYQTMRTLLKFEPDGRISQVVEDSGVAHIEVYDAADEDPADVAAEIALRYTWTPFEYEHEWPIRMALVRARGALAQLVLQISHHVADPTSALAMFEDMMSRDAETGEPSRPPGLQPLAQARLQQEPSALRQNDAALRFWEARLRVIPPTMFPRAGQADAPLEDRFREGDFVSPVLHLALRAVAARAGVNTGSVLFAAYAQALAETTGVEPVAAMITVNNRFRPGLASAAGHMSQHGLVTLDLADATFDDLARRARGRLLQSQKNAYYAQTDVDELIERIGRERGVTFDLLCLFNDRRSPDESLDVVPTEAEIRAAIPATTTDWRNLPSLHQRLMLHIGDGPGAVATLVQADTAYISFSDLNAFLRRLESIVVEAALQPVPTAAHHE